MKRILLTVLEFVTGEEVSGCRYTLATSEWRYRPFGRCPLMVGWTFEDWGTWEYCRDIELTRHNCRKTCQHWWCFYQVKCSCLDAQHDGQGLENPHLCVWNLKKRNGSQVTFPRDLSDFIELCVDDSLVPVRVCYWHTWQPCFSYVYGNSVWYMAVNILMNTSFSFLVSAVAQCFVRIG